MKSHFTVLIDDTSNENPSVIRPTVAKKIAKRRNTVNPNSPLKLSAPDLPLRKNSRLVHSSVLAISKNPIELENHFEDQTFTGTETHVIETNSKNFFRFLISNMRIILFIFSLNWRIKLNGKETTAAR